MFDIKKDIQAMTTFRRNPAKFLKHLKPLILTINGKAEAVVQDAEAYQRLLDKRHKPTLRKVSAKASKM
jgi:hypothetical protein